MESKIKTDKVKTEIGTKREGNKISYDYTKKRFNLRKLGDPYDHYEEEKLLPLVPYYKDKGSQTLTWQFTVPTNEFWCIADPGLLMNVSYQIKEQNDQAFRNLGPTERVVPIGFSSAVQDVKVNCNGASLSFALPTGSSLARYNNLGLRTTVESRSSATDEASYLVNTSYDEIGDDKLQSKKLERRLRKIKHYSQNCDVPIPLYIWPFRLLPIYAEITNDSNLQVARLLPEKLTMRLSVTFCSETDLAKHICNARKAGSKKFELKLEISSIYLRIKKYHYNSLDKGLMSLYRSFAKKHILRIPYLAISEASYNVEAGRSSTRIRFSPSSFGSKVLLVYFKNEKNDLPDAEGYMNLTKFSFPDDLIGLDITMGKHHLSCTPLNDIQGDTLDFEKLGFHEQQIQYHKYQCGPIEFFSNGAVNKFIVLDLSSYLATYQHEAATSLPEINFDLTWSEAKSPANYQLCIYSLNQKNIELDMSGQDIGLSAILSD